MDSTSSRKWQDWRKWMDLHEKIMKSLKRSSFDSLPIKKLEAIAEILNSAETKENEKNNE